MVSATASPSLLAQAGKERGAGTGGYHAVAASLLLDGNARTAAPAEEMEIDAGVGGCPWMASGSPPVALPANAANEWVVEGF